jgi:dihydroxyacetone kinase DhaKLM complex PTS-EIIA-like component DhaM
MEEDPMAAMEEENAKLRQSLFNLNKLFAEKFEAVQLNESAQQELSALKEQLEQKDELLTNSGLQNSKLLEELAGVREELSKLSEQLVLTEELLANVDVGQAALKAQLAAALEDAETARATAVAIVERIHAETEARVAATKQELEATQQQLAKAEDELVETKACFQSKEDAEKFDMIEIEDEGMEMDEWNIRSLNDKSTGVARLRY